MLAILAIGSVGTLLLPSLSWACHLSMLGIILPMMALFYLGGPAASVTVEPAELRVRNVFIQYRVPRAAITEIAENGEPALVLHAGERIRLLAFEPSLAAAWPRFARRVRDLRSALQANPEQLSPSGQLMRKRVRPGNLTLALGALPLFAGSAYFLLAYCARSG